MFFNISSSPIYRNFDENTYQLSSFASNTLFQKIQREIVINNRIKEVFNRIWRNKYLFEINFDNLNSCDSSSNLRKYFLYLRKENKKVFSIGHQSKEDPSEDSSKNFDQEDSKDESFKFFIEAVLENVYELYPEIIRISDQAKSLLLICGKKWSQNRSVSFKSIIEPLFNNSERDKD